MNKNKSITIVGGGATGVVFFNQLVNECKQNNSIFSKITIIDRHLNEGGLAYSTKQSSHLLNMSISTMSAVASEDKHLHEWLINKGYYKDKNSYIARRCYLAYLNDLYDETLENAKNLNIEINIICGCATNIELINNIFSIEINNDDKIMSDYLILSIGTNFSDPYNLDGMKGYIRNPYVLENYDFLGDQDEISILGTNLSAVDLLFTLDDIDFNGEIKLISRNGLLPFAKADNFSNNNPEITLKKISDEIRSNKANLTSDKLIDIFKNEILLATGENILDYMPDTIDPQKQLKISLKNAVSGKSEYQNIFQNVNDTIGDAWNYLSQSEKINFKKKYGVIWNLLRSPIPLVNAQKLYCVLQKRNIVIHNEIKDIKYQNEICNVMKSDGSTFQTKNILNSTGLNFNFSKNPLINSMVENRLAIHHESGGIDIDFYNNRIKSLDGTFLENAYGIGAISSGVHFVIHSVERSVKKCINAINDIFSKEK